MIVCKLLTKYFPKYVDSDFTSIMEESLDKIASGRLDHVNYLKSIYLGKSGLQNEVNKQEKLIDPKQSRTLLIDKLKNFEFKIGRYGTYVCTKVGKEEVKINLPDDLAPSDVNKELLLKLMKKSDNTKLGVDKESGLDVLVMDGRYGPYLQLGNKDDLDKGDKPKRVSIPDSIEPDSITLDQAVFLLNLPYKLGVNSKKQEVKVGVSRFGVYVTCDGDYRSVPKEYSIFDVDLKLAVSLLKKEKKSSWGRKPGVDLGVYPGTKESIKIHKGKYGHYLKFKGKNFSIKDVNPDKLKLEDAVEIIKSKKK